MNLKESQGGIWKDEREGENVTIIIISKINLWKLCVVAHVCNTSTREIEAEGSEVQSHPQLESSRPFWPPTSQMKKILCKHIPVYCLQRKGGQRRPIFLWHQETTEDHDLKGVTVSCSLSFSFVYNGLTDHNDLWDPPTQDTRWLWK